MSELSVKMASLKSTTTTSDVIRATGVARETFRRIERGETVKLNTLKHICESLKCSEAQWVEIMAAWVVAELGPDAHKLKIEVAGKHSSPKKNELSTLIEHLPHEHRVQITKAIQRPSVIKAIISLNAIYDSTHKTPAVRKMA